MAQPSNSYEPECGSSQISWTLIKICATNENWSIEDCLDYAVHWKNGNQQFKTISINQIITGTPLWLSASWSLSIK